MYRLRAGSISLVMKAMQTPRRRQPFFSRDESWLHFNGRVLQEAEDPSNPLLERVKFLAITALNLDEFVEIRLAGLMQRIEDGYNDVGSDGLTPKIALGRDTAELHAFVKRQYRCWNHSLRPALADAGIRVLDYKQMSDEQREYTSEFYQREVDLLLTPVTIDPAHPFPRVLNKALCVALLLRSKRKRSRDHVLGVVTVPRAVPRLVPIPSSGGTIDYIFLHDIIDAHAARMYRGYEVLAASAFRVTRNSNLYLQEEEARSVLESVRAELHNRRKGDAVRLEVERDADPEIINRLRVNFELDEVQVVLIDGPVNLSRVMTLYTHTARADLKYPSFAPRKLRLHRNSPNIFSELQHRDILIHSPYDSYDGVVNFIATAAQDPAVLSIKQTLYRTSEDSPLFMALIEAAQTKEVTVVVELKARFDEASNIRWARKLEDAGVQVFHGVVGMKTHCKLALMVRRDEDEVVRRYAHLGTGNYNPDTARYYTDLNLLTCDPEITASIQSIFNYLTAHSEEEDYAPLLVAPIDLAEEMIRMIRREENHARQGRAARIIAKINSLHDNSIAVALYAASRAGVEIDLIVRGICSLRPGVKDLSDHIRVRSLVGRFLEHSRIFYFANGGDEEIYCGSADWMSRNLYERCEVVFPVKDQALRARLKDEILAAYLADTAKTRVLKPTGDYRRARGGRGKPAFSAQDFFMQLAEERATLEQIPSPVEMGGYEDPLFQKKTEIRRAGTKSPRA